MEEEQKAQHEEKFSYLIRKRRNIWREDAEAFRNKKPAPVRQVERAASTATPDDDDWLSEQEICGWCGSTFLSVYALKSHRIECQKKMDQNKPRNHFSMTPPSLMDQADCLPDFWNLALQSLDIYQVHADDLPLPRRGKTLVEERSVGIRCTHCAKHDIMGSASLYFPGNIGLLATIIYKISDKHLMHSCAYIPNSTRSKIRASKQFSQAQSTMKGRIALPTYLREITELYQLVDAPAGNGIRRALPPNEEEGTSTTGSERQTKARSGE